MTTFGTANTPRENNTGRKYLTLKDLPAKGICFHANHLRRLWQATPPQFPPPTYLSERKFVWPEEAIDNWIAERMAAPMARRQQAQRASATPARRRAARV